MKKFLLYAGLDSPGFHKHYFLDSIDNLENVVPNIEEFGRDKLFYTQKKIVHGIGCIIEVEMPENTKGITYSKNARILARWPERGRVQEWIVTNRAVEAQTQVLKEMKIDVLKEALEPVSDAYAKASRQQRTLILAEAIRIITGGRS